MKHWSKKLVVLQKNNAKKKKKKRMYFSLKKVGEIKLYLKNTYQKNVRFLLR